MPLVKVFYSTQSELRITPRMVDLSSSAAGEKILSREDPSKWNFPDLKELWSGIPG
jgi:hypothetical protein